MYETREEEDEGECKGSEDRMREKREGVESEGRREERVPTFGLKG